MVNIKNSPPEAAIFPENFTGNFKNGEASLHQLSPDGQNVYTSIMPQIGQKLQAFQQKNSHCTTMGFGAKPIHTLPGLPNQVGDNIVDDSQTSHCIEFDP